MKIKEKKKSNNPNGNPYLTSWKTLGGYPWKLNDHEIVVLLTMINEELRNANDFPYVKAVLHSGLADKMKVRKHDQDETRHGNLVCLKKIQYLTQALNQHPGLMTTDIRTMLEGMPQLGVVYSHKQYEVIKNPNGNEVMVLNKSDEQISPLVREEALKTDIMENILDKMTIIMDSMTLKKIQSAQLGTLSKSLESLMKSYQMFKGEVGSKTLMQVNIGTMNLEQKRELSRNMAETK